MNKTGTVRDWESSLLGPPPSETGFTNVKRILRTVISAPEYSIADDIGFVRGQTFSLQVMMPQMVDFDLTTLGPSFGEPLFFFDGRIDPYCPGSVIADYVQTINACATAGDCVVGNFQPLSFLSRKTEVHGGMGPPAVATGRRP